MVPARQGAGSGQHLLRYQMLFVAQPAVVVSAMCHGDTVTMMRAGYRARNPRGGLVHGLRGLSGEAKESNGNAVFVPCYGALPPRQPQQVLNYPSNIQ